MLAPGTAAPVESSTLPETDAVTCARIVPAAKQMQKKTPTKACVSDLLSESIAPSRVRRNFWGLYSPQPIHIQTRELWLLAAPRRGNGIRFNSRANVSSHRDSVKY